MIIINYSFEFFFIKNSYNHDVFLSVRIQLHYKQMNTFFNFTLKKKNSFLSEQTLKFLTTSYFILASFSIYSLHALNLKIRSEKISKPESNSMEKRWSLQGMTALVTGGTKGIG